MLQNKKPFLPIFLVFASLNAFFFAGKNLLLSWGLDRDVVLVGNVVIFCVTLISFLLAQKGLKSANPHAFVRSIYTSMMVKLFACIIAAFIYIATAKEGVNKPALFTLMGLYLVYTFIEVGILTNLLRQKSNG